MTEDDDATTRFWAGVDRAAAEVRTWPAWKRGEWREYPGTVPMTEAKCALCPAVTSYPVGGEWAFPWLHGRVWRLCPVCAASDYLERLRALSEAREGEKTGARKGRRR